jgi:cytosine permease
MSDRPDLPPSLRTALKSPPLERSGWQSTIAPNYIGLFLWVVFFDQLARRTLSTGGLGWSVAGAAVAGLLCYRLLYLAPALYGFRSGRPLEVLGSSTFGARGSVWFTDVLIGAALVVWFAVGVYYAIDWTFQGFVSCRLLDPRYIRPTRLGGVRLESPVFLVTALFWSFATSLTGHYLMRIIAALMKVFPVIPALLLGTAVVLTFQGLPEFRPLTIDPATSAPVRVAGPRALLLMIQLIFGFFATAGVMGADWGAAVRAPRDVKLGGLVGVAFASWVVATLALLTVAGALGRLPAAPGLTSAAGIGNFSVRVALILGIGGNLASLMYLLFGLSSLAPPCFSAHIFGHRFAAAWPRISRIRWTLLGTLAAYPLIITGLGLHLEGIFTVLGAAMAPVAGAVSADYLANRGEWPGPRPGVNLAGLVAWIVGLAVGLVPILADAWGLKALSSFQPAAVFAYLAAFLVFTLLARMGLQPPVVPITDATRP